MAGHDVVEVRSLEAVEGGRGGHRVGAHVLEDQPVAHLQLGQVALLHDAVEAVARWTPDAAGVHFLVRLWLLLAVGSAVRLRWFEKKEEEINNEADSSSFTHLVQSWQAVGVVIEDTVEGAVNSIVDVVHQSPVVGPFVFLCGGDASSLPLLSNAELSVQHRDSFSLSANGYRLSHLPSEAESSSMMTFLAMMLTTSV